MVFGDERLSGKLDRASRAGAAGAGGGLVAGVEGFAATRVDGIFHSDGWRHPCH